MLKSDNTSNILLIFLINLNNQINWMNEVKAIDLDKIQPFNFTEIMKKTDEFIDMLVSIDIAYPVLSHAIKRNKELKYRYRLIRERKPKLFTD